MAGRAIWKGVVTFGEHRVAVKLYTAVRERRIRFHLLHEKDGSRLEQQMVCPVHAQPVPKEERLRGYEVDRGRYVVMEPAEVDALKLPADRTIELRRFVDASELDPRFFDRTYLLGPDRSEPAYAALGEALAGSGRLGICTWVMRNRWYLGALASSGGTLRMSTLRRGEDVVPVSELELPEAELSKREMTAAVDLIEALSADFRPERYEDEYQDRLRELIERKARGEEVELPSPRARPKRERETLVETLEKSLSAARNREKPSDARSKR